MRLTKKILFLLTTLFVIGIIAGCGGSSDGVGKINGLLTHSDEITPYPYIKTVLYEKGSSEVVAETTTDIAGRFYFNDISAGNYRLVFETVGVDNDLTIVAGTNTLHYSIN